MREMGRAEISKPVAVAAILALAIMPWWQGGRDPVGWMMLLATALLGSFVLWRSPATVHLSRLGLIWSGFVGWTALSLIWTLNRYQSFTTLLQYLLIGLIFVLAQSISLDKAARTVFSWAYIMIASLTSVIGLTFYIFTSYERATATFYLPNPLAGFLLPVIILGLWRSGRTRQWIDAALAALNLAVLGLTDSRGAILALILTLGIGLGLHRQFWQNWRRLTLILIVAVTLVFGASLLRSQFTHRFNWQGARFKELGSSDSASTGDRYYFLKSTAAIWKHYPIGGSGAGTYATVHPKYQYRVISAGNSVHNFYAQTLAELGLVGFGLLIYLLIELLLGLWRGIKADPSCWPLALGLLALLLHSAVDIDANYPVLWALAAILAGLSYQARTLKHTKRLPLPALTLIASLVLALPVVWLFQNQTKAAAAKAYLDLGDYDRSASLLASAHLRPPYDPDWLSAQGIDDYVLAASYGLNKTANLNQARQLAETAQQLDPDDAQHDLLLGRVLVQQGHNQQAIGVFQQAISKDPYNHPDYYNELAAAQIRQNQVGAASQTITKILQLYPDAVIQNRHDDPTINQELATSFATAAQIDLIRGQTALAQHALAKTLQLDPSNAAAALLVKQLGR